MKHEIKAPQSGRLNTGVDIRLLLFLSSPKTFAGKFVQVSEAFLTLASFKGSFIGWISDYFS